MTYKTVAKAEAIEIAIVEAKKALADKLEEVRNNRFYQGRKIVNCTAESGSEMLIITTQPDTVTEYSTSVTVKMEIEGKIAKYDCVNFMGKQTEETVSLMESRENVLLLLSRAIEIIGEFETRTKGEENE